MVQEYNLGRRFNGLHDYLFKLYDSTNQVGAFALTEEQFNSAVRGEPVTVECRFNEESLNEATRETELSLRKSATGWTMLLNLKRESFALSLSEDQLANLRHHYVTESVLVTISEAVPC